MQSNFISVVNSCTRNDSAGFLCLAPSKTTNPSGLLSLTAVSVRSAASKNIISILFLWIWAKHFRGFKLTCGRLKLLEAPWPPSGVWKQHIIQLISSSQQLPRGHGAVSSFGPIIGLRISENSVLDLPTPINDGGRKSLYWNALFVLPEPLYSEIQLACLTWAFYVDRWLVRQWDWPLSVAFPQVLLVASEHNKLQHLISIWRYKWQ